MRKINWNIFNTEFRELNHGHLSVIQVSKRGKITPSYLYQLFSKNHHPETVTYQMAYRIGRGLELSPQKSQNWANKLLRHTHNPRLGKSVQNSNRLARRSKHESSKSENDSFKDKLTQKPTELVEKRHPIVKFCPVDRKSNLALYVKQIMGNKQISMKNLCKATYLNKQRLHDLFNGKQKTVDKLTAVRIADGLDIPPYSLFPYNHYTPKIKTVVMSNGDNETATEEPLDEQICKLNYHDTQLIKDMVSRLLIAEHREKN